MSDKVFTRRIDSVTFNYYKEGKYADSEIVELYNNFQCQTLAFNDQYKFRVKIYSKSASIRLMPESNERDKNNNSSKTAKNFCFTHYKKRPSSKTEKIPTKWIDEKKQFEFLNVFDHYELWHQDFPTKTIRVKVKYSDEWIKMKNYGKQSINFLSAEFPQFEVLGYVQNGTFGIVLKAILRYSANDQKTRDYQKYSSI